MPELRAAAATVERRQPGRASGSVRALDGVDLVVERGELIAVMGGTGAGKSTLALALAGLAPLDAGRVDGDAAGAVRVVLQRPESTFLCERVLDEVAIGAHAHGASVAQAAVRARAALAQLGLPEDLERRDPLALSGGEQRRVAIAAVLATNPRVLILDEPGAGLDAAMREELHVALAQLHASGRTIIMITHDPAEAARLATQLVVLRNGRLVADGAPSDVLAYPERAQRLGIEVAPDVHVLHEVARLRGVAPARVATPDAVLDELARIVRLPRAAIERGQPRGSAAVTADMPRPPVRAKVVGQLPALPPLVDARPRIIACAVIVAAALMANTLLAATVVVTACAIVIAIARIDRARVRLAVRPLIALTIMLVALQLLVGSSAQTNLTRTTTLDEPVFSALLRALQASGVVLATLALSAATATTDLAAGMRRLLAPLRIFRVPVNSVAFVVATGLGLVPAFADELERLRLAQRARGLRPLDAGLIARLRADSHLLSPLFVAAFRRAHLLADALAVRGVDPRRRTRSWRPRSVPGVDLVLMMGGIALLAMSRFA